MSVLVRFSNVTVGGLLQHKVGCCCLRQLCVQQVLVGSAGMASLHLLPVL
jgi:hypothetical protein